MGSKARVTSGSLMLHAVINKSTKLNRLNKQDSYIHCGQMLVVFNES